MKHWERLVLVLFVGVAMLGLASSATANPGATPFTPQTMAGSIPIRLEAAPGDLPIYTPPPAEFLQRRPATATFTVNYYAAGTKMWTGTSDEVTCQTWPTDAQTAFNYAASIWGTQVNSSVAIKIDACWGNTGSPTNLGKGGGTTIHRNFSGAPQTNTWYIAALANALSGTDQNGSTPEIQNAFNSSRSDWYFGTGSSTPSGQYNFASVVLHEIGHGLGFLGSMSYSGGVGYWGQSGSPYAYDRFVENGGGTDLIAYTSGTTALGTELTSNNVYFNGTNANAANGSARPKLYAPASWSGGSSIAHLDETTFNGTTNALMTPFLNSAETNHNPGAVTRGIMKDMGWGVSAQLSRYLPLVLNNPAAPSGPTPGYWSSSGGGTTFYVTPAGTIVRRFAIVVNLSGCGTYEIYRTIPDGDAAIASNQFSFTGSFYASGTFDTVTAAHGTTGLNSYGPICSLYWTGGPWSWSTTWQNSTQPTMPLRQTGSEIVGLAPVTGAGYDAFPVK